MDYKNFKDVGLERSNRLVWTAETVKNRYNCFNENGYGEYICYKEWPSVSIKKFRDENKELFNFDNVSKNGILDIQKLNKYVHGELSDEYVKFVLSIVKDNLTTEDTAENIKYWFVGVFGEIFFISMFLKQYTQFLVKVKNGKLVAHNFSYVIPYFVTGGTDYFGDFIAVNSDNHPIIGQIKFWNAYTNNKIGWDNICGKLCAADTIGITDSKPDCKYVFWIGNEDKDITISNRKNPVDNQFVYVGRNSIRRNTDTDKSFINVWNDTLENLK